MDNTSIIDLIHHLRKGFGGACKDHLSSETLGENAEFIGQSINMLAHYLSQFEQQTRLDIENGTLYRIYDGDEIDRLLFLTLPTVEVTLASQVAHDLTEDEVEMIFAHRRAKFQNGLSNN